MATVQAPPVEAADKELVYEWFREQFWPEEAYLALSEASNHLLELSDGRLVILPMPTSLRQRILKRFVDQASAWLDRSQAGEMLFAPHPIRLWAGKYREPDAMIWLNEHRDRIGDRDSEPPDFAVEIHSPSSEPLDSETKFREYAQAGIAEYWMVNPETRRVSIFTLEGRAYKLLARFSSGERARSNLLPGLEITVDSLFPKE